MDLVTHQKLKVAQAARIADIGYENAKVIHRTFKNNGRRLKKRTIKNNQKCAKSDPENSDEDLDDDLIWQMTKEEKPAVSPDDEESAIKLPEAPGLHDKYELVPIKVVLPKAVSSTRSQKQMSFKINYKRTDKR